VNISLTKEQAQALYDALILSRDHYLVSADSCSKTAQSPHSNQEEWKRLAMKWSGRARLCDELLDMIRPLKGGAQ